MKIKKGSGSQVLVPNVISQVLTKVGELINYQMKKQLFYAHTKHHSVRAEGGAGHSHFISEGTLVLNVL